MNQRLAMGLQLRTTCARAILVNICTGAICGRGDSNDSSPKGVSQAALDAVSQIQVSTDAVIGIGIVYAEGAEEQAATYVDRVGRLPVPGELAGRLKGDAASILGLHEGTAVSVASEEFACVPGVGVASPSTMVLLMRQHTALLMNSRVRREVPGVRLIERGILPGYIGYRTSLDGIGEELEQFAHSIQLDPLMLIDEASKIPPGALYHASSEISSARKYRAILENNAFRLRHIVETICRHDVPVRRFVATGPYSRNALLMQIYVDVLNERFTVMPIEEPALLGGAILGCLAAGPEASGYQHTSQVIHAMAPDANATLFRPDLSARRQYEQLYRRHF